MWKLTGPGRERLVGASCALLLLGTAACSDDGTAGPETGTDIEDITKDDAYFGDDRFIGETVTISAEVTDVLSPRAFVLNGRGWGDDSVIVLSAEDTFLAEENVVQVTGTVGTFAYADYQSDYGLADRDLYAPYLGEEFLVADEVRMTFDAG